MLRTLGYEDLAGFLEAVVPQSIAWRDGLKLPDALSETEVLAALQTRADLNQTRTCMIGLGYSGTITPGVIRRNVLENPAWYTAYTPYQPEIAQGRLEALLNFQTLVEDLTGLPVAGASLLDEPTAVAEAMAIALRTSGSSRIIVDADLHPQIHAVLATRAEPIGAELEIVDLSTQPLTGSAAAVVTGYPGSSGALRRPVIEEAHEIGAMAIVTADLLALTLLTPPGELGADIVVGSAQRFGVPFGFGGPHAGYMSVRAGLERNLPGRLVGVSVDADGTPAYRLALQTREQHIRREKATSNICTAQVLLAVIASMYVSYHGPEGLRAIAQRVHAHAARLAHGLRGMGIEPTESQFFDTVRWRVAGQGSAIVAAAADVGIDIRLVDEDTVSASTDERTSVADVDTLLAAVADVVGGHPTVTQTGDFLPAPLLRTTPFLTHPVFHSYRSETAMLRYLRRLADRDVALDRSMIPLGSCTMKLNATTEMEPITWSGFADIHPFAPLENARGYLQMIDELESYLCEVTGYDAVSLQPNAGSQGEFAGLLAIRAYHRSRGEDHRDICLIPSSAHGTNAASAVMAGMRVIVVSCDEHGNVDLADVREKIAEHGEHLAALMVTYPSTHGVFETEITDLCALVHEAGGQVYVDGANLNALIGLAKPGKFGADVSHLNLHKTFCIPHGGGGPGVGPIGVREHLADFLPGHPMTRPGSPVGPVSGAPWGSAGILPIPWAYIRLMGPVGLADATAVAILSANYVASRLRAAFPILYVGQNGRVAHECILDVRPITAQTGISVDDIAKRLMDYGFHAPTMSFPVAGTLMVEPTESENLAELDRFIDAMLSIRAEIEAVARGDWPADDNPLVNAPHTASCLIGDWQHPYPAELAAYPMPGMSQDKVWPNVRRVDGAYGDRNLVCACPRPEELAIG
jgi:glycine dehydrogenase